MKLKILYETFDNIFTKEVTDFMHIRLPILKGSSHIMLSCRINFQGSGAIVLEYNFYFFNYKLDYKLKSSVHVLVIIYRWL